MTTEEVESKLIECSLDKKQMEDRMLELESEYRRLAVLENKLIEEYIAAKEAVTEHYKNKGNK